MEPAWASGTRTCYWSIYDADHDGYAAPIAPPVETAKSGVKCPSGYVRFNGDCNDRDAGIHPRRGEVPFNGVDENCNEKIDETEFVVSAAGNANTETSFRLTARVNDVTILNGWWDLWAEVELTDLSYSATPLKLPWFKVTDVSSTDPLTVITVSNLSPATVYKAVVRFFRPGWAKGQIYAQAGADSVDYFTTTDGSSHLSQVRTDILLRGFKELHDSNRGLVGYMGTVKKDGTRYGAGSNELWCSEFYVWVTKPYVKYLELLSGYPSYVDGVIAFFGRWWAYHDADEIVTLGERGDYMPSDSDGDGDKNHSTMLLAVDYSSAPSWAWTLEGNSGNQVKVELRPIEATPTVLRGLGHLTSWLVR